jgi:8-oxo-dGTP pyrophosphatase MutT (NUDIX family)
VSTGTPVPRTAARMFLIDDDRRVLLMHERRDIGSDDSHWITPGGGVEPGESLVQGAIREVYEETGMRVELATDSRAVYAESVVFSIGGATYDQTNHYFLARVPSGLLIEPAGHTEVERLVVLGHRWWSLADLDASDAVREPVAMVEVINRALALESHT